MRKKLKKPSSNAIYLFLGLALFFFSTAQAQLCQRLFETDSRKVYLDRKEAVFENFFEQYALERATLTPEQIQQMNAQTLAKIQAEVPEKQGKRVQAVPEYALRKLLQELTQHKTVSLSREYERPDIQIGYCFGRATYVHLKLLALGVQKESIQKIWVVGPMNSGNITWRYHVATMAYSKNNGWMVVDNYVGRLVTIQEWMDYLQTKSIDGKVRFYNSDASKFIANDKYLRHNMGMDFPREFDWFKGYFFDMMASLKQEIKDQDPAVRKNLERSSIWQNLVNYVSE